MVHRWTVTSYPRNLYKLSSSRPAVFCVTTVTNPLEEIGPPNFERLRNRIPWGCRKLVHGQTHNRTADIRVLTTPKTILIFQGTVTFQEPNEFLWTNLYWIALDLQIPKRYGFTMLTLTQNPWNASKYSHLSEMSTTNHSISFWTTRNLIGSRDF